MIDHFHNNVNCPYQDPNDCLFYPSQSFVHVPSLSLPLQDSSSSSHPFSNDDAVVINPPPELDDSQVEVSSQSSSDSNDDHPYILGIEGNPDFPPLANNIFLQDDSDLSDPDNSDSSESSSDY